MRRGGAAYSASVASGAITETINCCRYRMMPLMDAHRYVDEKPNVSRPISSFQYPPLPSAERFRGTLMVPISASGVPSGAVDSRQTWQAR
jgi:hypothetical protein